ncbi:FG-GAP repeat protein [Engelhardtia mirabilis]|uniref:FG-GAP repeat protein n=1 Tax=Engelhardtia mirabilis TaxID=2528011 RepID=A0A518BK66_9BACT|nr:hypothetical protein Pla133_24480 [Planctomycetes bacterium Pla133]QDV01692.1 hypothetical protein Pla86_24470 [Planctomycetes bacterium Pla86]
MNAPLATLVASLLFPLPALAQCELESFEAPLNGLSGFGRGVELQSDRLVVSSAFARVGAHQSAGFVQVWAGGPSGWQQSQVLTAPIPAAVASFGLDIALSGQTLAISQRQPPLVRLYHQGSGGWTLSATLAPSPSGGSLQLYGERIALAGDRLAVGAPWYDVGGTNDDGAVYLYRRIAGAWELDVVLTGQQPGLTSNAQFGSDVALDGSRLLVGAPFDDSLLLDSGAACLFEAVAGGWSHVATLLPSPVASDPLAPILMGQRVALRGSLAACGAADGDVGGENVGGVYVFEEAAGWSTTALLLPADVAPQDRFGTGLAVDGSRVIAGSSRHGKPTGPRPTYIFERGVGGWEQTAKLQSSQTVSSAQIDELALDWVEVAVDGGVVAVGRNSGSPPLLGQDQGSVSLFSLPDKGGLSGCPPTLSLSAGGIQNLDFDGDSPLAGLIYLVLGSMTEPTSDLAVNGVVVPLGVDGYLSFTLSHPNTLPLQAGLGLLDPGGSARARFAIAPGTDPSLAGSKLLHALLAIDPAGPAVVSASNQVGLVLLP